MDCTIKKGKMKPVFKHQHSLYGYISLICLILASKVRDRILWIDLLHVVLVLCTLGVFVYQIRKQLEIGLYDILGFILPTSYCIGILCTPLFEMSLYVYWGLLFISMVICMYQCKEEDTKAIALLHLMYMTSCALAIPVWLRF